jgi:hypothetical protein
MEVDMQCKCGGNVNRAERRIETDQKTIEWTNGKVTIGPVELIHLRCDGCGREGRIVEDLNGRELYRLGA